MMKLPQSITLQDHRVWFTKPTGQQVLVGKYTTSTIAQQNYNQLTRYNFKIRNDAPPEVTLIFKQLAEPK